MSTLLSLLQNSKHIIQPWTHWFLLGDTGSGKTTVASSFPRPLFIVPRNEGSMTTLMGGDFPYKEISTRQDMDAILKAIEDEYARDPNAFPFDTIVIESVSHYTDLIIEELTSHNRFNMDQLRWGHLSSHLRSVHSRLRALDVHTVFTSLAKIQRNKDGEIIDGGPLLQGQMSYKLPSACDVFAYCEVREGRPPQYETWFSTRKSIPARSRFRGMPPSIKNFRFADAKPFLTAQPQPTAESNGAAAVATSGVVTK